MRWLWRHRLLRTLAVGMGLGNVAFCAADCLQARFGAAALLRAGLVVEAATHATLAVTTTPLVAAAVLVLFGVHTMVWGVIVVTLRQRVVPGGLPASRPIPVAPQRQRGGEIHGREPAGGGGIGARNSQGSGVGISGGTSIVRVDYAGMPGGWSFVRPGTFRRDRPSC